MIEDSPDISIKKQMSDWGNSEIGITQQLDDFETGKESLARKKLGEV